MNIEIQKLGKKCDDLDQSLCETVKQRDKERSEITKLNEKLRQLQLDTEKVVIALKGMCLKIINAFRKKKEILRVSY